MPSLRRTGNAQSEQGVLVPKVHVGRCQVSNINTWPTFPAEQKADAGIWQYPHTGITLRDYFAGKELSKTEAVDVCGTTYDYARLADHCYRMADAMLAERAK